MREEARNWWEQAKHDLKTADVLLEGERLDAASFYYQQAVEKALKGLHLLVKKESPELTHSLTRLARDCGVPARFTKFLRNLTTEYFLSRYPTACGDIPFETYDVEELQDTSARTHEVMEWVEQQVSKF